MPDLRATDTTALNRPTTPYHCAKCPREEFSGMLRFEGDPVPLCPNHWDVRVEMVAVTSRSDARP